MTKHSRRENEPSWKWRRSIRACLVFAVTGCVSLATSAHAQTFTVIHSFSQHSEGAAPYAPVVQDAAGDLYGTTFDGGAGGTTGCANDCGVAYALDSTGDETVLYTFARPSGGKSEGGLIRDSEGNLYGTTLIGGDFKCDDGAGCGTVFKLDAAGTLTVLHSFKERDGAHPGAALLRDTTGNLYGTTWEGGAVNRGTVFKIDTTGKETVLHSFRAKDGAWPLSGLIGDAQGNLYGTTELGGDLTGGCGTLGCGVVYKIDRNGHETVLYSFTGGADGSESAGNLARDAAGNLYGTTGLGGDLSCNPPWGCGVVFKIDSAGHETVLHSFEQQPSDGWNPHRRPRPRSRGKPLRHDVQRWCVWIGDSVRVGQDWEKRSCSTASPEVRTERLRTQVCTGTHRTIFMAPPLAAAA